MIVNVEMQDSGDISVQAAIKQESDNHRTVEETKHQAIEEEKEEMISTEDEYMHDMETNNLLHKPKGKEVH